MFRTTSSLLPEAGKVAVWAALAAWLLVGSLAARSAQATGLEYVDAMHGMGGNLTPATAITQNAAAVGKWDMRPRTSPPPVDPALGSGGRIYESTAENAPELKMTVTSGLIPGASYDLYAVYWSDVGISDPTQNWTIRAGVTSQSMGGELQLFDRAGTLSGATRGTLASSACWVTPPLPNTSASLYTEGNRVMLLGKFGPAVADGGNLIAFVDDFSSTNAKNKVWLDGIAYAPAGTQVFLTASIDRTTGELTINNSTAGGFQVKSCTVTSAGGALDATVWNPINDDLSFDADPWNVTAPGDPAMTPFATALTETEAAGATTSGGSFASTGVFNLGEVWRRTPIEDVSISLTLADDSLVTLTPSYTGSIVPGDFDGDGAIDLEDFSSLRTYLHTSVASLTRAESFVRGDMNVDLAVNRTDFRLFRAAYDVAHGVGAFDAAVAGVPEPGGLALAFAGLGAGALRRRWKSAVVGASFAAAACVPATGMATTLTGWQIDTLLNGAAPLSTAGSPPMPVLGNGTANSADNAAIFASFAPVQLTDGQQLAFSGKLTTTGATAAPEQLRFGLFKDDADVLTPATAGWRGHLAQAGDDMTPGGMLSRTPGASGFNSASFMQTTGLTAGLANPALDPEHQRLLDDEYEFSFTIRRFGNEIEVAASIVGELGFQNIWDSVTESDLSRIPVNFAYDRAGVLIGDGLNADQVVFSQLDIASGPIKTLVLQVNSNGAMRVVNNAGAPVNLTYYEITSDGGSLNVAGWKSLDDQEGGDLEGTGWDEVVGNTESLLSEIHLQSTANVAASGILPLGSGFQSGFQQDLEFRYIYDSGLPAGTLVRGGVQYVSLPGGDFNNDTRVNGLDFSPWKTHFGASGGADANWDGASDGADFLAWQQNFGLGGLATAVPEPMAAGLWLWAYAGAAAGRRQAGQVRAC